MVSPGTTNATRPGIRTTGPRLDPDARDYIDLITAAGADLGLLNEEAITKKAISDSFIERKDLYIWDDERRTYMPIWGVAAANAICQRSLTSGTFFGGVTHGAGFVQGDGTSGYFVPSGTMGQMGISPGNASLLRASRTEDTRSSSDPVGRDGSAQGPAILTNVFGASNQFRQNRFRFPNATGLVSVAVSNPARGVFMGSAVSTSSRRSAFRDSAGYVDNLREDLDAGGLTSGNELAFMAGLNGANPFDFHDCENYAFMVGVGMTQTQCQNITRIMRELGETLTQITSP